MLYILFKYLVIESLIILSLNFRQLKFWSQYLQNIKYMVKQRGIIDAKCLIFYLKQELGLDALFGEGAGPETAEKGLLLVQTDPQVLHTEGQLLQGAVFHVLHTCSNRKWVRMGIKIQYMAILLKFLWFESIIFREFRPIFEIIQYASLMRIQ